MTRTEFESRVAAIFAGADDAVQAVLADECYEVTSGAPRGKGTISVWLDPGGFAMINDTARGMRMSAFPHVMPDFVRILDEEEAIGPVHYIDGKRDVRALGS